MLGCSFEHTHTHTHTHTYEQFAEVVPFATQKVAPQSSTGPKISENAKARHAQKRALHAFVASGHRI
jgi:hypothetical protein